MNALHFASNNGQYKVMERLLTDGRIPPDLKTSTGYSNTYLDIRSDHSDCLRSLLIDPQSDLNIAVCPDGYRAIDFACIRGHVKSLEVILGLDYWLIDSNTARVGSDTNPFCLAVESNQVEVVTLLLSDK
jgi:ankyrin repeat protein